MNRYTRLLKPTLAITTLLCLFFTSSMITASFIEAQSLNPTDGITQEDLDSLNPLKVASKSDVLRYGSADPNQLTTFGGIISRILEFMFPIAIGILFIMLIWAGFEMFTGATNKSVLDSATKRATMAVLGFVVIFVSYWLIQLLEAILGISILF